MPKSQHHNISKTTADLDVLLWIIWQALPNPASDWLAILVTFSMLVSNC